MIKNIGRPLWPIFICFCSFMISGCEIVDFIQEESSTEDGTIIDSCGSAESGCAAPDNATADCVNSQCVWECNEGYHINDPRNPVSCVSDETITELGLVSTAATRLLPMQLRPAMASVVVTNATKVSRQRPTVFVRGCVKVMQNAGFLVRLHQR